MKTILAIVGMAGVGKDTAANYLKEKNGWNVICSYTNRPMRNGETQGKEHIFVTNKAPETTFAYTNYVGYDYWTDIEQFRDDVVNIYVVDEYGKENCALVSTFSLRKSKSALKDTGKVHGIEKEVYDYVASLIPEVFYLRGVETA